MRGVGGYNVAILGGLRRVGRVRRTSWTRASTPATWSRSDRFADRPGQRRRPGRWTCAAQERAARGVPRCGRHACCAAASSPREPQGEGRYVTPGRAGGHAAHAARRGRRGHRAPHSRLLVSALAGSHDRARRASTYTLVDESRLAEAARAPARGGRGALALDYRVLSDPATTTTRASPARDWRLGVDALALRDVQRARPTAIASRSRARA